MIKSLIDCYIAAKNWYVGFNEFQIDWACYELRMCRFYCDHYGEVYP